MQSYHVKCDFLGAKPMLLLMQSLDACDVFFVTAHGNGLD